MASQCEINVCQKLRPILDSLPVGSSIPDSAEYRDALSALEWFISNVLREIDQKWDKESLDGIFPLVSKKNGDLEIEIVGRCILITDQTLVPIHVQFQLSETTDEISWMDCKLGKQTKNGMERVPYSGRLPGDKRLYKIMQIPDGLNEIDWAYHVQFGERRVEQIG